MQYKFWNHLYVTVNVRTYYWDLMISAVEKKYFLDQLSET